MIYPYKFSEDDVNVTVNLEGEPHVIFNPSNFTWTFSSVSVMTPQFLRNDSRRTFDYANATFRTLNRSDSGTYVLRIKDNDIAVVGRFTLKVLCT